MRESDFEKELQDFWTELLKINSRAEFIDRVQKSIQSERLLRLYLIAECLRYDNAIKTIASSLRDGKQYDFPHLKQENRLIVDLNNRVRHFSAAKELGLLLPFEVRLSEMLNESRTFEAEQKKLEALKQQYNTSLHDYGVALVEFKKAEEERQAEEALAAEAAAACLKRAAHEAEEQKKQEIKSKIQVLGDTSAFFDFFRSQKGEDRRILLLVLKEDTSLLPRFIKTCDHFMILLHDNLGLGSFVQGSPSKLIEAMERQPQLLKRLYDLHDTKRNVFWCGREPFSVQELLTPSGIETLTAAVVAKDSSHTSAAAASARAAVHSPAIFQSPVGSAGKVDELKTKYLANGGSRATALLIFTGKDYAGAIAKLKERASKDASGASHKTLEQLGLLESAAAAPARAK